VGSTGVRGLVLVRAVRCLLRPAGGWAARPRLLLAAGCLLAGWARSADPIRALLALQLETSERETFFSLSLQSCREMSVSALCTLHSLHETKKYSSRWPMLPLYRSCTVLSSLVVKVTSYGLTEGVYWRSRALPFLDAAHRWSPS
jgi:hypothetical protein